MDFIEKSRIRIEHWIEHNEHHIEEYKDFVDSLKKAGKFKSAQYIEEMINLVSKSNEILRNALNALEE